MIEYAVLVNNVYFAPVSNYGSADDTEVGNNNQNWSNPYKVATFEYAFIPSSSSIAVDPDGNWHIVYPDSIRYENYSERRFVKYMTKTSTEIIAEEYGSMLTDIGVGVGQPSIAIDPNGGIHIIYIQWLYSDIFNQSIMYVYKNASSNSWSTAQQIATFEYSYVPSPSSIAVDSDGNWHIVYPDRIRYENNTERRYVKYINKTSKEILVEGYGDIQNYSGEGVGHPSIAIDSNGELHVIYIHFSWEDWVNQSIMYITKEQSSHSWSTAQKITTFSYSLIPSPSSIAIDPDGDWHIVYPDRILYENKSESEYVKHITKTSTEILADGYGNRFNSGEGVGHPSIAIDQNGGLHVIYIHLVWRDYKNQSIMYIHKEAPTKSTLTRDTSLLNFWWLFIIGIIVFLIVSISLRKKRSPISKQEYSEFLEGTHNQITTDTKKYTPPPPSKSPPLPPPLS